MAKLSIVILNYNTKDVLLDCLGSIVANTSDLDYEIVVVDNGSSDGSVEAVKKLGIKNLKIAENTTNLGFAAGNNTARKIVGGDYVLMLNSDTLVNKSTLKETVSYIESHKDVGALGCKILLPDGTLDKDSRRSFPTPWVAFTHFSGIDRLFPKSKLFAKYWYWNRDENETHEADVLQGAFTLVRKKVLDEVGWYDEDYFLDGEDIDLCWKIKEKGWRIVYFPKASIIHIKKVTKSKFKNLRNIMSGVESMEIFYKKRLWNRYPLIVNLLVLFGINVVRAIRYIKLLFNN
ncbi:glycosyltransferase family 2 protein [Candidatus Woesebacteria bacterium]|nr:glycosyltransferase family 2 protein [Candidatus Woesebacteria bacterium]